MPFHVPFHALLVVSRGRLRTAGRSCRTALVGSAAYTADDKLVELDSNFQDVSFNVYGEYGLTDRITLVAFGTPIFQFACGDQRFLVTHLLYD